MSAFSRTDTSLLGQWWWTVDRWLLASFLVLMALGMLMALAASPAVAVRMGFEPWHFVLRQVIWLVPALGLLVMVSVVPASGIQRLSLPLLVMIVAVLIWVSFLGPEINGSRRWLPLFGFSIQPIEFAKPVLFVVTAWFLAEGAQDREFPGFACSLAAVACVTGLLVIQPDFGQALLVVAVWGAQLCIAGLSVIWIGVLLIAGIGAAFAAYTFWPHVASRIDRFFDPASGDTYQVDSAVNAFVRGGLFGQGPGEGEIKQILPDAHSDYIFAVIGEEYGLFACLLILLIFGSVIARGFIKTGRERDLFTILVLSGLLLQFSIQAVVNVGVNLNLLPSTGMTLPFVSYGGSSLLGIALAMGIVLAFTRSGPGLKLKE